jgi:hypothetical protein
MKKLFAILAVVLSVATASAQRASDMGVFSGNDLEDWNHSAAFIETHLGAVVGDVADTGFGWGFGIGYRWHISSGFCWDVAKLAANTDVTNFTDMLDVRVLSGFRYNSPRFVAGKSLYLNAAFGYHIMTQDSDYKGFAYEVGTGVNLTRHLSLGLTWDASSYKYEYYYGRKEYSGTTNWGTVGLKLGVQF